jgi:hypothetical protein
MSKFLIFSFVLLLNSSLAFSKAVHHGSAELLNEKAYSITSKASYFYSTSTFDSDGVEHPLLTGTSFKMMDFDLSLGYGFAKNIEFNGLFRARTVSVTDTQANATNQGPESVGVLLKYAFNPIDRLKYAVGFDYRKTLYTNAIFPSNAVPQTEVVLGDDGTEFGFGLYANYFLSSLKWDGILRYVLPPNELSAELHYNLVGQYLSSKYIFFAGFEGIFSKKSDSAALRPLQADGPTQMFNTANREYFAPYGGVGYMFESFTTLFSGKSILRGRSYDKGNSVSLSIKWGTEGITTDSIKIDSFKEYQIEGSVLKVSARGNYVKIDQGLSTDVEKGTKFDIYQTDYFGGNVLVASGYIQDVGSDWSVIKITKKYNEIEIKPGFAARGY